MKFLIFLSSFLFFSTLNKPSKHLPQWFIDTYHKRKLDIKYEIKPFINPAFLSADFDGDGSLDIVQLIIEKRTKKKGLLLILNKKGKYFVFGAGTSFGKKNFDEYDNYNWMDGWSVYTSKIAYETKFDNGDIVGTSKRYLSNKGISIWANSDGAPLAGGIIYWNGQKFCWIHQGE